MRNFLTIFVRLDDILLVNVADQLPIVRFKFINEVLELLNMHLMSLNSIFISPHLPMQMVVLMHDLIGICLSPFKVDSQIVQSLRQMRQRYL